MKGIDLILSSDSNRCTNYVREMWLKIICGRKEHRSHMLYKLNGPRNLCSSILSFAAKSVREGPYRWSRLHQTLSEFGNNAILKNITGRVEDLLFI